MAERIRPVPAVSENKDFRAVEAFYRSIEALLKMVGSTTTDTGSIASGALAEVTITVNGARPDMGQTVQVGLPSAMSTGLVPWANVTDDDTVILYLYNRTGSPIAPGSQTYYVRVMP